MTLAYHIQPAILDLIFKAGDQKDFSFRAYKWNTTTETWEAFDLTGMQVDIKFRRKDGLLVKSITSSGLTPTVSIAVDVYTMLSIGFASPDVLDYDVQVTDGTDIFTIQEGQVFVKKQYTD